jgi:MoxR-like ATPase
MFRDDEAARAQFQTALERRAERADELEARVFELEAENQALRAQLATSSAAPPPPQDQIYVDAKLEAYVLALIKATDPRLTEGILVGAPPTVARPMIAAARAHARTAGRPYANPDDVRRAAHELLPSRIMMQDPAIDPRSIVRAIVDVVEVP